MKVAQLLKQIGYRFKQSDSISSSSFPNKNDYGISVDNRPKTANCCNTNDTSDTLWASIRQEAIQLTQTEPLLKPLLEQTILSPQSITLQHAISRTIASRLVSSCNNNNGNNTGNTTMCLEGMTQTMIEAMESDELEYGHTMADAVRDDIKAILDRDPACHSGLEVVLFYKGFAALFCHRVARRQYGKTTTANTRTKYVSLWLQSQASAAFAVDIHPLAEIGSGVFFDHATGLVVGETAVIGDGCTILHGVTLGGTGKDNGDRHPKVGNNVLIGAGASILGNIKVGSGAKIGCGSIVLKPIPHGATAVGAPAKIIGWAKEKDPGSLMDLSLKNIMIAGNGFSDSWSGRSTVAMQYSDSTSSDDGSSGEEVLNFNDKVTPFHVNDERGISNPDQNHSSDDGDGNLVDQLNPGVHKQRRINRSREMCAFRSFVCKNMPEGAICYDSLNDILKECSDDEVGEVYMDLMKQNPNLNYIPASVVEKNLYSLVRKYTRLSEGSCKEIVTGFARVSKERKEKKERKSLKMATQ